MEAIETFIKRVTDDGGTSGGEIITAKIDRFLGENNLYDDTKILICPEVALKTRGTVPLYVTKSYDLSPNNNDAIQTTETSQPFLAGNIAPNERLGWKTIKTTATWLSHNTISFTTAEPWSFTVALKSNGNQDPSAYEYVNSPGLIGVRRDGTIRLRNDSLSSSYSISVDNYKRQRGKINFLTVIGLGSTVKVYFNGVYVNQTTLDSNFSFESDITGLFLGNIYYRRVQSGAMTLAQVEAEHAMLRSIYPEIESVQIGTQTWATSNLEMVATPMGNPINEMQLAAATEKITNGGFDSDTGWTITIGGWSISGGKANCNGTGYLRQYGVVQIGKYIKVSVEVSITSGGIVYIPGNTGTTKTLINGVNNFYILQNGTTNDVVFYGSDFVGSVDNVSIQEVGWSDSSNLYNYIYANTSGTADQKEYAAVRAAAMWCYYNNDPVRGATYGKLYNWYAVKLLQTDIDAYNAANPTTPWGWKVPTDTDFETLRTTIASNGWNYDGSTDSGTASTNKQGKALASDSLWIESAVEGAPGNTDYPDKRNISGFTGLPGGYRGANGSFYELGNRGNLWFSTEYSSDYARYWRLTSHETTVYRGIDPKRQGYSVRLLKS